MTHTMARNILSFPAILNISKQRHAENTQKPIISTHGPYTHNCHTHITHVNTHTCKYTQTADVS